MGEKEEKREPWAPAFHALLEITQEVLKDKPKKRVDEYGEEREYVIKSKKEEWAFNKEYSELEARIAIPYNLSLESFEKVEKQLQVPSGFFTESFEMFPEFEVTPDNIGYDLRYVEIKLLVDKENKIMSSENIYNSIKRRLAEKGVDYPRHQHYNYGLLVKIDTTDEVGKEFLKKMKENRELFNKMVELQENYLYVYPACERDREIIEEGKDRQHKRQEALKKLPDRSTIYEGLEEPEIPKGGYYEVYKKHRSETRKFLEHNPTNKKLHQFFVEFPEAHGLIKEYDEGGIKSLAAWIKHIDECRKKDEEYERQLEEINQKFK